VAVIEIVVIGQGDRRQGDDLAHGVYSCVGDICIGQTVKKVVGTSVLLKNNHHVLDAR